MMDDVDRDCCSSVEKLLKDTLPGSPWTIEKREFHDPGMTLVLKHEQQFSSLKGSEPRVTVRISYGGK